MSKCFSYTASFKLKVIKYAKKHGNRAAERQSGPPPTGSAIRLGGNRKTASSDAKTEEGNARGTSKVAGGGARGADLNCGTVSN